MDGAACRNADTRQFFPARGSGNHTDWAIAASICATCNVSPECLAYALRNRCVGVWGGTTDEQRKGMAKPCVDCGTDVGVRPAHSQRCAPCQEVERRRQKYAYAREVARYREVAS
jgi:WhiB family redox-sensing transcriptional regulator